MYSGPKSIFSPMDGGKCSVVDIFLCYGKTPYCVPTIGTFFCDLESNAKKVVDWCRQLPRKYIFFWTGHLDAPRIFCRLTDLWVFAELFICGELQGKTRVIVVNQLWACQDAAVDWIVYMDDCRISEQGKFDSLMDNRANFYESFKKQMDQSAADDQGEPASSMCAKRVASKSVNSGRTWRSILILFLRQLWEPGISSSRILRISFHGGSLQTSDLSLGPLPQFYMVIDAKCKTLHGHACTKLARISSRSMDEF